MTERVLVTGATGFLGRAVVPLLQQMGFELHLIGRNPSPNKEVIFHAADLLVSSQVSEVLTRIRPSHLLHLAWYAEPGLYWTSARNLEWLAASLHLVRCFAENGGQRAVVAGTCAEYKWGDRRLHETRTVCAPATIYGAAKDSLRRVLEIYAASVGLSLAWGRIFYLYGPNEKPDRLVSTAIERLLSGHRFPASEGAQRRDFLYIVDAAAALATLLQGSVEGPVNIGSGRAVAVRTVLTQLASEIGRAELLGFGERPLPPAEPSIVEADNRRLSEEVGFAPAYDLERGLAETVAWWRSACR